MTSRRMYTYLYSKPRRSFGRQAIFQDVSAHLIDSIGPNKLEQKLYILRNPVHQSTQASCVLKEHEVKAKELKFVDKGINHEEGGWPKEVNIANEENIERYVRKVVHDDTYIKAVLKTSPAINHSLNQNNAVNMYESYFEKLPRIPPPEVYKERVANVLRDPLTRPISSIAWTNEDRYKLAVSYCSKEYRLLTNPNTSINTCHLWDINKSLEPFEEMEPLGPCWKIACSPAEPEVFVGGLEDGTVNLFDVRAGKKCMLYSNIFDSHQEAITSLFYTASRTNTEFFTGSLDGQCFWWDIRKMDTPVDQIPIYVKLKPNERPNLTKSHGVSSLEFDRNVPTKFLCGTESGYIINVNKMGKTHAEILSMSWEAHNSPVRSVQRSPCTTRMFISSGDWSVRIWSEEIRTAPIIVFNPFPAEVTGVTWSPLRFSSFMAICANGKYYYYDVLRSYNNALEVLHLSKYSLTNVLAHQKGEIIAVSDSHGAAYILLLADHMIYPGSKDRQLMQQTYERETNREHILENRIKEIRLKQRTEKQEPDVAAEPEPDEEQLINAAEEEYWRIVNEELAELPSARMSIYSK